METRLIVTLIPIRQVIFDRIENVSLQNDQYTGALHSHFLPTTARQYGEKLTVILLCILICKTELNLQLVLLVKDVVWWVFFSSSFVFLFALVFCFNGGDFNSVIFFEMRKKRLPLILIARQFDCIINCYEIRIRRCD